MGPLITAMVISSTVAVSPLEAATVQRDAYWHAAIRWRQNAQTERSKRIALRQQLRSCKDELLESLPVAPPAPTRSVGPLVGSVVGGVAGGTMGVLMVEQDLAPIAAGGGTLLGGLVGAGIGMLVDWVL